MNASSCQFDNQKSQQHDSISRNHTPQAPSSLDSAEIPAQTIVPTADAPATRSIRQRKRPSQRRIEANRRNAKRSTGPRTAPGKKAVSRNAITHGLLAREVVILDGSGAETKEDFDALLTRLIEHYQPANPIEQIQVEKMAVALWRQARVLRAENGEIRKRLGTVHSDILAESAQATQKQHSPTADQEQEFVSSAVATLRELRRELSETRSVSKRLRDILLDSVEVIGFPLTTVCVTEGIGRERDKEQDDGSGRLPNADVEGILAIIDRELQAYEIWQDMAPAFGKSKLKSETLSRSLPSAEPSYLILRYDAHFERQFYRAMHELERLQRRRMGEVVPPPLTVRFN